MFNFITETRRINNIIKEGEGLADEEYIVKEINRFLASKRRKEMIDGERYYAGAHDILKRKRQVIGENGKLEDVDNLPNNRIVDNQYQNAVDKKNNYLLGQPFSIQTKNEKYLKILQEIFNARFRLLLKNTGEDSLNCGLGWIFVYYDGESKLSFRRFKPHEIIPGWKDAEHTKLDYAIRIYDTIYVKKTEESIIQHIELYAPEGIYYFTYEGGKLVSESNKPFENYFTITDIEGKEQGYNWTKIPLIPLKYNNKEIPIIKKIKTLQDALNLIESNFINGMEEDVRNTILVLVNYDGENLAQFRKNLAQYGAVKVKTIDKSPGDVKTLQIEVNSENYKVVIELLKKAIIENARSFDAKDDRLSGSPNEMNIQSMYSDIDIDANGTEAEYQFTFEELLWFINCHLYNTGVGDFFNEKVDIIFNRDMLISETTVIDNINKSEDLSLETRLAQHPWVDDVKSELDRIKKQKKEEMAMYPFPNETRLSNEGDLEDDKKE